MRSTATDRHPSSQPPTVEESESGAGSPRPLRHRAVDRAYWLLLAALLATGAAGQIRVWASDRGLWNDEIYIANNLRILSVRQLFDNLHYSQVAPPGWLVGEKTIFKLFGPDEQLLKLPEVIAAIVVLLLTGLAAYQATGRWASLVAVGLLVTSPQVYYYAGELKQYAFEAALAMVILVAAGACGRIAISDTPPSRRQVVTFAAIGAVASAGSYSALVVLPGVAAGIGLVQASRRQWRGLAVTALAAAPGVLVGAGFAWRRWRLGLMSGQHDYFPNGFAPEGAGPIGILRWLPDMWQGFTASPLNWGYPAIAVVLVAAGLASLVVRGRPLWAAMLGGVFVAAIGAGALRGFPLEDRTALYLVAPTAIAVAAAVDGAGRTLAGAIRDRRRVAGTRGAARLGAAALLALATAVGLAGVVRPASVDAYHEATRPRYRDDGRDMLRQVASRLQPGDVVVAYYFSEPIATWYGRQYKLPVVGLAVLKPQDTCEPATVDQRLAGAKRVWYVHGAGFSQHPLEYNDWVVGKLAARGTVVEWSTGFQSRWALIDLTAGPDSSPPPVSTDPAYACLSLDRLYR